VGDGFYMYTLQAAERQYSQVVTRLPWGLKLGACREHRQHTCGGGVVDKQIQHLECRGIYPMQVLPHGKERLALGLLHQPRDQRGLRPLPLLSQTELQGRGVSLGQGHRQECSAQRNSLGLREVISLKPLFQLGGFGRSGLVVQELQPSLKMRDERMQIISATSFTVVSGQTASSRAVLDTNCPRCASRHRNTAKVLGRRGSRCGPCQRQALVRSRCMGAERSEGSGGIKRSQHTRCGTMAAARKTFSADSRWNLRGCID
jgi:hypothetical protein